MPGDLKGLIRRGDRIKTDARPVGPDTLAVRIRAGHHLHPCRRQARLPASPRPLQARPSLAAPLSQRWTAGQPWSTGCAPRLACTGLSQSLAALLPASAAQSPGRRWKSSSALWPPRRYPVAHFGDVPLPILTPTANPEKLHAVVVMYTMWSIACQFDQAFVIAHSRPLEHARD